MDSAQVLLIVAGVILIGNFWRAPTQDRSLVAVAAFLGLSISAFAQLPYHGWYVISVVGIGLSILVLFSAVVFLAFVGPILVLPAGNDACWKNIPTEDRVSLAAGFWTADISAVWLAVQWAKSLPADTNVPAIVARILCPVLQWPDHLDFEDPNSPGLSFRPVPGALLTIESMTGFMILTGAMAYSLYHHMQRRKIVTPVSANGFEAVQAV